MASVFLFDPPGPAFEASIGLSQAHAELLRCFLAGAGEVRDHPFVAEDARAAALLADHPLVTGPLQMRFCASAPMSTANGTAVGAVCVLDDSPRQLTQAQGAALGMLARQAVALWDADIERKNGERLELALSGGDIGLWDLDVPTGKAAYNEQWWRMFGYAPGEIEQADGLWKSMVHPSDYAAVRDGLARHVNGETEMYEGEARVRHKDGRWLWIQNRAKVVERSADGTAQAKRIVGIVQDVTERRRAEINSAESERRLRGLTDNVPALITELDIDERVVFCNGTYEAWFGVAPASMMQQPLRETLTAREYALRRPHLEQAFAGETVTFEHPGATSIGQRTLQTIYLPQRDGDGSVKGLYCLTNDVSDLKETQKQLDALARKDALTGLPNRRFFEERVQEAIARTRRRQVPIGVMYLDLDRFKSINDSVGHAGGDAVLQEFAHRLRASLRETDVAARYAGDEFVVLLEDVADEMAAEIVATKILHAMNPTFSVADKLLAVTTSIGVAMHCGDSEDLKSLLSRADLALYSAKKEGRNRVKVAASMIG